VKKKSYNFEINLENLHIFFKTFFKNSIEYKFYLIKNLKLIHLFINIRDLPIKI
jgi:hypothetical protein